MMNWGATSVASADGMSPPSAMPSKPFLAGERDAEPNAAGSPPPAATTPTTANCDAPVNTSNDMAIVLATVNPVVVASTPNATPNTPVAAPMTSASRT